MAVVATGIEIEEEEHRTDNRPRSSSQTGKPRENISDFKLDVGPVVTRAVEYERKQWRWRYRHISREQQL
jgi:hypothetical protein